jgi:hypothetical protein
MSGRLSQTSQGRECRNIDHVHVGGPAYAPSRSASCGCAIIVEQSRSVPAILIVI